jgi:hypothetical protein
MRALSGSMPNISRKSGLIAPSFQIGSRRMSSMISLRKGGFPQVDYGKNEAA